MEPKHLAHMVKAHLDEHAARFGLHGSEVNVEYRYYGGSLERRHYTVSDGAAAYHLKLERRSDYLAKLRKWFSVRETLHENHHAPNVIAWIDVPGTDFSGLLCEHVPGHAWEVAARPELASEVIEAVHRLHEDLPLQKALRTLTPGGSCRDYLSGVWIRRIRKDLAMAEAQPPAFVSAEALRWLRVESIKIEAAVSDLEAFSHAADSPVHGDLWPGNILVTDDGHWRIVDWDDLALGDPALEYAVLLEPMMDLDPRASPEDLLPFAPDAAFIQRFDLCLRAQRLYIPIEAAAEYIEGVAAGDSSDALWNLKREVHLEGLIAYARTYMG